VKANQGQIASQDKSNGLIAPFGSRVGRQPVSYGLVMQNITPTAKSGMNI
jgi:hypothetical protein